MARDVFGGDDSGFVPSPAPSPAAWSAGPSFGTPPVGAPSPSDQEGWSAAPTSFLPSSAPNAGTGAPLHWLAAAGVVLVVALVVGALAHLRPVAAGVGWFLAGFVAVGLLAVYTVADARRRTDPWYTARSFPEALRAGLVVVAVAAVVLNSFMFADWWSRR